MVYAFRLDDPLPGDLRLRPLLEDRLHVALPPDHRLVGRRRIALAELADDPMAWQGLVAAGAGVAVIPRLTLPTARDDIVVRELDAPSLVREVSVAMAPGRYTPPAAEAMAAALAEVAGELAGAGP